MEIKVERTDKVGIFEIKNGKRRLGTVIFSGETTIEEVETILARIRAGGR